MEQNVSNNADMIYHNLKGMKNEETDEFKKKI